MTCVSHSPWDQLFIFRVSLFTPVFFLDAPSHLYKRLCPSVGPSVGASVGPYVPCYFRRREARILGAVYPALFVCCRPLSTRHKRYTQENLAYRILWDCINPFRGIFQIIDTKMISERVIQSPILHHHHPLCVCQYFALSLFRHFVSWSLNSLLDLKTTLV